MEYTKITAIIIPLGIKIFQALAIWLIGGIVIKFIARLLTQAMIAKKIDPTLIRYIDSIFKGLLKVFLIIAILDIFGVQTTSLAALMAAAGIAIGAAWAGLLSNFAAGFFLIVLRPYKVGDVISAAGVSGEVVEIGLFVTSLHTGENAKVFVGNGKIFADVITNFSMNTHRRVDLKCQLAYGQDPLAAIEKIKSRLLKVKNVLAIPAPEVEIIEINHLGPLLVVRPFCLNAFHSQVLFDTNKALVEVMQTEKFITPSSYSIIQSPL
jgi:small conductance mechanosensitive channel